MIIPIVICDNHPIIDIVEYRYICLFDKGSDHHQQKSNFGYDC